MPEFAPVTTMTAMAPSLARPPVGSRVVLEDGTYDALGVRRRGHRGDRRRRVTVELTILAGDHKGEVVSLSSTDWSGDALDLLGIPATITVADGHPSVVFEP